MGKTKNKKIKIKQGRLEAREARMGYLFLLPWLIGVVVFLLFPLGQSFYYMWFNIRITPLATKFTWVGTGNFTQIWLENPEFPKQLVTYIWQTIVEVPVIVVFALIIAMMLNGKIKCKAFFRLIFFLPVIIATGPVYAIITGDLNTNGNNSAEQFSTMFEADLVDQLLEFVGIYGFGTKFTEMLTTVTSDILNLVWKCGIQIIIFLSALQGIPTSAKEAAAIEGATAWEFFWKITLPYVSPMILVNIVYTVIDSFTDPTNEVMSRVLEVQRDWQYGYSASMAWSYFGIILIALGIIFAIMNKLVWYDD